MDVVGHEAVGMQIARVPTRERTQVRQVHHVIDVLVEARVSVIPALYKVHGHTGKDLSRMPRHMTLERALGEPVDGARDDYDADPELATPN
jgi:hypothetical protein